MKKLLIIFFTISSLSLSAYYRQAYAEDWYKMFTRRMYSNSLDYLENITYLERALKGEFINPNYALVEIIDEKYWLKYKTLFLTHVSLKLVEQYMQLGARFDKHQVRFYDKKQSELILDALNNAEHYYKRALYYWERSIEWSDQATELRWVEVLGLEQWNDEAFRILDGDLNYEKIIYKHLDAIEEKRAYYGS